jgi:hypothetical protein
MSSFKDASIYLIISPSGGSVKGILEEIAGIAAA